MIQSYKGPLHTELFLIELAYCLQAEAVFLVVMVLFTKMRRMAV